MKFVDEIDIFVKAGNGGNGCVSFRREKFIPKGGPDGGNGGRGGNVYIVATSQISTLSDLRYKKVIQAPNGEKGKGKDKYGKNADDVYIKVPVGTIIRDKETGEILFDLVEDGKKVLIVKGGRGGRGNMHFVSSTRQSPYYAEEGKPGEERHLVLELKLLADVGIIGYPNAGKSTFISVISNVKPKISDYPFTTLTPNLGVVNTDETRSFVVADIPGLIEGAANGKGLGIQFLKHIERTKILLHLIDITISDINALTESYTRIRRELSNFGGNIDSKPELICLTKVDTVEKEVAVDLAIQLGERLGKKVYLLSSVTGEGVKEILNTVVTLLDKQA